MRQTLLAAASAFVVGGIAAGAVLSQAQPAPPAMQQIDAGSPGMQRMDGVAPPPWMHGRHGGGRGPRANPGALALIYRQPDRQLTAADVQKIAEGFLLWNGNHTWKVTDVAAAAAGPIGFSLTTPEGSVVAKFTMDPHSGKIVRVG